MYFKICCFLKSKNVLILGLPFLFLIIFSEPAFANNPPTASATISPGTTINEGTLVTLSGKGIDPDLKDQLKYQWVQKGGTLVVLQGSGNSVYFTAPDVDSQTGLKFVFYVTDSQGLQASVVVNVTVNPIVMPPPATPPGAPANFAVTPTSGAITLSWSPPSNNGGSPITSYKIEVKVGAGSYTPLTNTPNTSFQHTGVTPGQTYTYRVFATNAVGTGNPSSSESAQVPQAPPPAVDHFPPIVNAEDETANPGEQVELTATASSATGMPLSYYWEQIAGVDIDFEGQGTPNISFTIPDEIESDTEIGFQITVSDGTLSDTDSVYVKVTSEDVTPPPSQPPTSGELIHWEFPDDIPIDADDEDGAYLNYDVEATDENGDDVPFECDPLSGSLFPIGETEVTCTAEDSNGDSVSDSFTITIVEPEGGFDDSTDDDSTDDDSTDDGPIVSRTSPFTVRIKSVEPTDQNGNPVNSFEKDSISYAKVLLDVKSSTSGLVTVNLFDSSMASLGLGSFKTNLNEGDLEIIVSFSVPRTAVIGSANLYAGVYSNWPNDGGVPLTTETSSIVRIK